MESTAVKSTPLHPVIVGSSRTAGHVVAEVSLTVTEVTEVRVWVPEPVPVISTVEPSLVVDRVRVFGVGVVRT